MKKPLAARLLDKYLSSCTVTDLALRADVHKSYISHLRTGLKRPSIQVAAKLEQVTGGAVPVRAWAE